MCNDLVILVVFKFIVLYFCKEIFTYVFFEFARVRIQNLFYAYNWSLRLFEVIFWQEVVDVISICQVICIEFTFMRVELIVDYCVVETLCNVDT